MSGTDLQHLFATVLTDPAPDTTDVEAAMRTVRRRRRVRTGALMLSAAAVVAVIALVVGGVLDRTAAPQPAASPSAVEGILVTEASQLVGTWWTTDLGDRDVRGVTTPLGVLRLTFARPQGIPEGLKWSTTDGCHSFGGELAVDAGRIVVDDDATTLTANACFATHPENADAVQRAGQARLVTATSSEPARLVLIADGRVIARYTSDPAAAARKDTRLVLTSLPAGIEEPGMAAIVTGKVTIGNDGCVGLDGRTTVWPADTRWSTEQDELILPDGTPAAIGDTVSGSGGFVPAQEATKAVADAGDVVSCSWSDEVALFNPGWTIALGAR